MGTFDENFAQQVAYLCYRTFDVLPKSGKPIAGQQWTTIAAIVKHQTDVGMHVLSLGTGTKCIGESKLSASGDVVNDSHAEVLARRGFLLYLYNQIELTDSGESEIFARDERQKMKLRDGVTFHLFANQTPCGDASIFPNEYASTRIEYTGRRICAHARSASKPESFPAGGPMYANEKVGMPHHKLDVDANGNADFPENALEDFMHNNDIADIHRTGAKCLPGEALQDPKLPGNGYHIVGRVRTKPGRGDRTLSVSCSDKLLRWNFVGIQGALLAVLIEPIYLSSIIVGCDRKLYSYDAMRRAVINRNTALTLLRPLKELPLLIHVPIVFKFSKPSDNTGISIRPSPYSIVWTKFNGRENNHQVYINGQLLGRTKVQSSEYEPLLVSKKQFLRLFKRVTKSQFDDFTYAECKMLSTNYCKTFKNFKLAIGMWTEKDRSLETFK